MKPSNPQTIKKYIKNHILITLIAVYFIISVSIKVFTGIDICIPCLWKTIFGFECPGCGLTTAFIAVLQLNPAEAFHINPLIFIVLPAMIFFGVKDYHQFKTHSIRNNIIIL